MNSRIFLHFILNFTGHSLTSSSLIQSSLELLDLQLDLLELLDLRLSSLELLDLQLDLLEHLNLQLSSLELLDLQLDLLELLDLGDSITSSIVPFSLSLVSLSDFCTLLCDPSPSLFDCFFLLGTHPCTG